MIKKIWNILIGIIGLLSIVFWFIVQILLIKQFNSFVGLFLASLCWIGLVATLFGLGKLQTKDWD